METEQKQKKILFAGLTILVFAAIFLYSASLLERNTPYIQPAEPFVLTPTETESEPVTPKPQRVKAAEPVPVASNWKTYRNAKYGIEFRYPKEWPAPVLTETRALSDGSDSKSEPIWQLGIGDQKPACEGELCHLLRIWGYRGNNHQAYSQDLKNDEFAWIESEKKLNGADAIIFASGGMCGYRNAYIFGKQTSLRFTAHCGEEDPELGAMFDAILSTFKLTK